LHSGNRDWLANASADNPKAAVDAPKEKKRERAARPKE
jgi:hypothetical protein